MYCFKLAILFWSFQYLIFYVNLLQLYFNYWVEQQQLSDYQRRGTCCSISLMQHSAESDFVLGIFLASHFAIIYLLLLFTVIIMCLIISVLSSYLKQYFSLIFSLLIFFCSTGTKSHCKIGQDLQLCQGWCRLNSAF